MKTKELLINSGFEESEMGFISRVKVMAILLLFVLLCGITTTPEVPMLIEEEETASRASSIISHKKREVILISDNEWKVKESVTPVLPVLNSEKTTDVEKTEKILSPKPVITQESMKESIEPDEGIKIEESTKVDENLESETIVATKVAYTGTLRNDYCIGSTIELSDLCVIYNEENVLLEDCEIIGVDTTAAGEKLLVITYNDETVEIPYSVVDYTVTMHGISEEKTYSLIDYKLDDVMVETPFCLGKEFTGWYRDEACTVPFVTAVPGETHLDLYAGWKDFDVFSCDAAGYITGYTGAFGSVIDGLLKLPSSSSCVGVRANAFVNMEEFITDIYIPANITDIEAGAFDSLPYVFYIYVHPNNPCYSSKDGILYTKDMSSVVAYPLGR